MTYNPALDGLRGVAVIAVIAFHCRVPGLSGGFFGGFLGVDIFFVLSGFLITGLLQEELQGTGRVALVTFYLRRFLRLTPPLALMLLAYLAAAPLVWPEITTGEHLAGAALAGLYLTDYSIAFWRWPEMLGHTWSLSVEEHYYLLWPALVLLLFRLDRDRQLFWLAVLLALATLWRIASLSFVSEWETAYSRFDTRMSGLLLGGLLRVWLARGQTIPPVAADALGVLGIAGVGFSMLFFHWGDGAVLVWGLPLVELASAAIILAASDERTWVHRRLSSRPLVWVGLISYGLYLWHYPIARALRETAGWPETLLVTLALSLALAALSYHLIERPIRRLRRRWKPSLKSAAIARPLSAGG
jgi:peptidoglycan/LPS O-acetylase OafA/YrhL